MRMEELLKSVYSSQDQLISAIIKLYVPAGFDCDMTYGRGGFWRTAARPPHCFDILPTAGFVVKADTCKLPLVSCSITSAIFDLPFLCYVSGGRALDRPNPTSKPDSVMSQRFGGYWSYEELSEHYRGTLREANRILKPAGILAVKCQDIIYNHHIRPTHASIIQWASDLTFRLTDILILINSKKILPVLAAKHGRQRQQHARIQHSYFLIFRKNRVD